MRLPTLTYEQLTPRQQETWKKHAERRDKPVGPYLTWLHSPDLMDKVSPLSNYFRFDCNLPAKLQVVLQVLTDPGQVLDHGNPVRLQQRTGPDA